MKITLRGEGSTDIGKLDKDILIKGAVLILIEKLYCYQKLYETLGSSEDYNFIEWIYIHKEEIKSSSLKRKKMILRGKKEHREKGINTQILKGFYNNSESFAFLSKEKEADIAIFFVDTDNDTYDERYNQVKAGLKKGGFEKNAVPMIATKISEAWLLCCLNNYKNCAEFEQLTNDKNNHFYPKTQIEEMGILREEIAKNCDPNKIDMPSFNQFREDFQEAIHFYMKKPICE